MGNEMKARLKNPVFIMAISAFVYQVSRQLDIEIDRELFLQGVDLVSYILIGTGIYKTFTPSTHKPKEYIDKDNKSE